MPWSLEEAVTYYKAQGAPRDQSAVISLLKEAQRETGGAIARSALQMIAQALDVRDSYLLAIIRRIPGLRLENSHLLEICAGPNCGKCADIAAYAETLRDNGITVKFLPCMRLCGKGPNIRWDGKMYHQASEAFLRELAESAKSHPSV